MSSKLERLERANAELQRELREREGEVKRLAIRSSLDKDAKRCQILDTRLRDACRELESMEGELVSAKDKAGKLQYEVDILRTVVHLREHPELLRAADAEVRSRKLEQEVRSLKGELVGVTEKCRVYFESCAKAGREADSLRYECTQLQEELAKLRDELKRVAFDRDTFAEQLTAAASVNSELREQVATLTSSTGSLQEKLQSKSAAVRQLEAAIEEARIDDQNSRRTWEEGHRQLQAARATLKDVLAERDKLSLQCRLSQEEELAKQRRFDSVQRTLEALQEENRHMRDQLAAWQMRADEIDAVGRQLSLADAEHGKTAQLVASLEEHNKVLQQRVSGAEKECVSLSHQLDSAREELALQVEQTNILSRNLMDRLEKSQVERNALEDERQQLVAELATAREKASTLSVLLSHHQALSRSALATSSASASPAAMSDRLTRLLDGHRGDSAHNPAAPVQSPTRASGHNSSDIALSPPTPHTWSADRQGHDAAAGALRSKLERISR